MLKSIKAEDIQASALWLKNITDSLSSDTGLLEPGKRCGPQSILLKAPGFAQPQALSGKGKVKVPILVSSVGGLS